MKLELGKHVKRVILSTNLVSIIEVGLLMSYLLNGSQGFKKEKKIKVLKWDNYENCLFKV